MQRFTRPSSRARKTHFFTDHLSCTPHVVCSTKVGGIPRRSTTSRARGTPRRGARGKVRFHRVFRVVPSSPPRAGISRRDGCLVRSYSVHVRYHVLRGLVWPSAELRPRGHLSDSLKSRRNHGSRVSHAMRPLATVKMYATGRCHHSSQPPVISRHESDSNSA